MRASISQRNTRLSCILAELGSIAGGEEQQEGTQDHADLGNWDDHGVPLSN